jgi:tetratricopeptide (TPR) repeat protein
VFARAKIELFLLCTLLILTAVVYYPSLKNGFTNWDDDLHITENPSVKHAAWTDILTPGDRYLYHPLTIASYAVQYLFWKENPQPYHAVNLILHLANIALVFIAVRMVMENRWQALAVASLFALHPLQVESVAWISGRKELLFSFFSLLSLVFYLRAGHGKIKQPAYIAALLFFICAILSKPVAVMLPLLLLGTSWYRDKKIERCTLLQLIPFTAISAIGIGFSLYTQSIASPGTTLILGYSGWERFLLSSWAFLFYWMKSIVPLHLSAYYGYPAKIGGNLGPLFLLAPFVVIVAAMLVAAFKKLRIFLLPGALWYTITIAPLLQVIPFNNASYIADRYFYFPSLGIFLLFTGLGVVLSGQAIAKARWFRFATGILAFGWGMFFLVQTSARIEVWRNSITLFNDVIEKNPMASNAYNNRGQAKLAQNDFIGSFVDCSLSIMLKQPNPLAYYTRGNVRSMLKDYRNAIADYDTALMQKPDFPNALYNRGNAHGILGQAEEAVADYNKAIALRNSDPLYYYSRGVARAVGMKQYTEAESDFTQAILRDSLFSDAYSNRAALRFLRSAFDEASTDYHTVLRLSPGNAAAKQALQKIEERKKQ